jgi:hypothetical protein
MVRSTGLRVVRGAAAGVAAAAVWALVVAAVVAVPGGDAGGTTSSGAPPSCTEVFGLTDADNAGFVTFALTGTAAPFPAIGDGLTPVATITTGDGPVECVPELGFANEDQWVDYLPVNVSADPTERALVLAAAPLGAPGYLLPAPNLEADVGAETSSDGAIALRIEADDPALEVSWDPQAVTFPAIDQDELIADTVIAPLGGPDSDLGARMLAILEALEGGGSAPECGDVQPTDDELAAKLVELSGVSPSLFADLPIDDPCLDLLLAFALILLEDVVALRGAAVAVEVNGPAPAPAPAAPRFTG